MRSIRECLFQIYLPYLSTHIRPTAWWRHKMETFSALLALCAENSSSVNSPHMWRGALMFALICAWINGWVNNGEAGDLRRPQTVPFIHACRWGELWGVGGWPSETWWRYDMKTLYALPTLCGWLFVTGGFPHRKCRELMFSLLSAEIFYEWTDELPVIREARTLTWVLFRISVYRKCVICQ